MTAAVIRYRCDLCGLTWLMERQAALCEQICAEEEARRIEAGTGETPEEEVRPAGQEPGPKDAPNINTEKDNQ